MGSRNKLTEEEVKHIAELANLPLSGKEIVKFQGQLSQTLDYIAVLGQIETKDILPTSQVTGLVNVYRKDEITSSLTQEEALKNAPNTHNGFIKIKTVKQNDEQS